MTGNESEHAKNARTYRAKAAELAEAVRTTRSLREGSDARRSQQAYAALADNEEWLAKNADKIV